MSKTPLAATLVFAALSLLPLGAFAQQIQCLEPSPNVVIVDLPGGPPIRYNPPPGSTYDARGETFTEPTLNASPAVIIPRWANNTCLVGPTVIGPVRSTLPWNSANKPDGIEHLRAVGPYVVDGAWITRVNDALSPPKAPETPRAVRFSYRHIYAREIGDDFLENDACLGGEITDSLVDGAVVGFSMRPGRGDTVNLGDEMPTVKLERVGIRVTDGQWWKISEACRTTDGRIGPHYELRDVVLYQDRIGVNGINSMFPLPPQGRLHSVENVTVLYTGPGELPLPSPPVPGLTIVRDKAEAEHIWKEWKDRWLTEHGCDTRAKNCAYLTKDGMPQPPPPPPPPPENDMELDDFLKRLRDLIDEYVEPE